MDDTLPRFDVVMLGTFGAWNLGTLQARAIPLARELGNAGVTTAIVTTPWDTPSEAGVIDCCGGVPIINTAATSLLNPMPAVRQQIEWVTRLAPQIVHLFKPKGFGGFAARFLQRRYPLVVDSDDWEGDGGWNDVAGYSWAQRRVFHHQEHDLIRRADQVTAASTLLVERARRLRHDRDRASVRLLENGLTMDRTSALTGARTHPPSSATMPVVLIYSRFEEFDHGWLGAFISALADACTSPVTIRVVGPSPPLAGRSAGRTGVRVDQMGYVASHRVPAILGSATLAVYPYRDSLITRSKQSVKLLEQMAAGCPVIASDVGDVARTLGAGGVAIRDDSPFAFARLASNLLACPQRLDEMSAAGTTRILNDYSFSSLSQRLIAVYRAAGLQ